MAKSQFEYRQSFVELFRPPAGYHTDFVGMTTFSLSLRLLVWIPSLIDCGDKGTLPPRGLGTAIHRMGYEEACNKFRIYYDGQTKAAVDQPSFYGTATGRLAQQLLATRCTPVNPDGGLFHPKILLFQFSDKDNRKFFRVHISSRNLTMGHLLEAGVILESVTTDQSDTEPAKNLAAFWRQLCKKTKAGTGELDLDALEGTTLKLCERTNSQKEDKKYFLVDCALHFGGLDKLGSIDQEAKRTLKKRMQQDRDQYGRLRVISMNPSDSLFDGDKPVEYVCNFPDLYEQPETGTTWKRKNKLPQAACVCQATGEKTPDPTRPRSLHIKEYLFSNQNGMGAVWIGSANCSDNALNGKNVEVMVRYEADNCPMPLLEDGWFCQNPGLLLWNANVPQVENPRLPDDPADRFLKVRAEESAIKGENGHWTLTVKLYNGEEVPVKVWLPRGEKQELKAGANETKSFSIDRPSRYSLVLLMQRQRLGEDTVYTLPLDLDWDSEAGSRKDLICKVPLDPMESVREMIPVIRGQNTATDEVYERAAKWQMLDPEHSCEVFRQVLADIQSRCREVERLSCSNIPVSRENAERLKELLQKGPQEDMEEEEMDDLRLQYESACSTVRLLGQIEELRQLMQALLPKKEGAAHE